MYTLILRSLVHAQSETENYNNATNSNLLIILLLRRLIHPSLILLLLLRWLLLLLLRLMVPRRLLGHHPRIPRHLLLHRAVSHPALLVTSLLLCTTVTREDRLLSHFFLLISLEGSAELVDLERGGILGKRGEGRVESFADARFRGGVGRLSPAGMNFLWIGAGSAGQAMVVRVQRTESWNFDAWIESGREDGQKLKRIIRNDRLTDGILSLLFELLDGVHIGTFPLVFAQLVDPRIPRFPNGIDSMEKLFPRVLVEIGEELLVLLYVASRMREGLLEGGMGGLG